MIPAELPRAQQLILDALHLDRTWPVAAAAMQDEDWEEFSRLAKMHRLGPLLHDRLGRGDLAAAIPQNVRDQLKASQRKYAIRNLAIYRELVAVTRMLDAAQIPSIALKGAFLARFAYAEPGLRPMRDLDLLLRPEQAVQAFELLKSCGYQPFFDGSPEAYILSRRHMSPLISPEGISIELHHRLTDPASHRELSADFIEVLWGRSISNSVGGTPIRFFCPEDSLLHVCVHATMEHLLNLGPLALSDVAFLVETRTIDWKNFLRNVSDGNWQRCVLPLLYLARRHLGADIPDEVLQTLGRGEGDTEWFEAAEYLLFSDPEDHKLLDYDVQELLYSKNFSARLSTVAVALFPPRSVIARHFPVSERSMLAYLYYPRRWFRLFTGKLPPLLKARFRREGALRQLASHRSAFADWLHTESADYPE